MYLFNYRDKKIEKYFVFIFKFFKFVGIFQKQS